MGSGDLFQLVQIAYWLALATWFGGVLFIAVAAPIIHRIVNEAHPTLPHVLAVNLEDQHSTLLAGSIISAMIQRLTMIELVCAGTLLVTSLAQLFLIDLDSSNRTAAILRGAMLLGAAGLMVYRWLAVWPKIQVFRIQYIDHADDPDIANPAKDQFDREQKQSETLLMVVLCLLLGMILFSGNIAPRKLVSTTPDITAVEK